MEEALIMPLIATLPPGVCVSDGYGSGDRPGHAGYDDHDRDGSDRSYHRRDGPQRRQLRDGDRTGTDVITGGESLGRWQENRGGDRDPCNRPARH